MPDPASDLGGGLVAESVGSLNFRQEVLDGFAAVRVKHEQLQALLHQVMRRVALPRCREIGNDLLAVKAFYPVGKKGSASKFYADAKALTGLSKPSIANYIQISENWPRLMDYMADLPDGATPITSLRGALEAIREMNRPLKLADSDGAVDIESQALEGEASAEDQAPGKRTHFASTARKAIDQQLSGLRAVKLLTPLQQERLAKVQEALQLLLDDIDRTEAEAAVPTVVTPRVSQSNWQEQPPEPEAPAPAEDDSADAGLIDLKARYPFTAAGLEAMETDIAEHGSGKNLAIHLGNTSSNPSRWISDHRRRIKKALEA